MGLFDRIAALARGREVLPTPVPAAGRDPLGLIGEGHRAEERGDFRQALGLYDEAVALAPTLAKAHLNRGNALLALGDAAGAADAYRVALQNEPQSAAAHYNLGNACAAAQRLDDAFAAYRRAIELDPDFADAEVALGVLLEDQGRADEAAERYRRALRLKPGFAPVHGNLAAVLLKQGRLQEAVASYRRALEFDPGLKALHLGLAEALLGLQQLEPAVSSLRQVLQAHPDHAPAHGQLGQALQALGRSDEALASLRRAVQLEPNHVDGHCLLGNLLSERGQLDDALACYDRMLQIDPGNVLALNNRGGVLRRLGRMAEAAASYERATEIEPDLLAARSNLLFIHHSLAARPSAELLSEARRFGEAAARAASPLGPWAHAPDAERPLRIGLVSGDLRSHPVGYFLVGVLASLVSQAAGRLQLHAYANQAALDEVSARIRASCRGWRMVADLDDAALARQIRSDGIDILIDLAGHTGHTRVQAFAWKAAPVQVTWLGYLATTGVEAIDYLLADPWTLPPEEEPFFTERIWRLPETYLCFTPPAEADEVAPLPALSHGGVTFASFNNLTKMTDEAVAVWSRVLQAVPGSRLLLKAQQFQDIRMRQEVAARFAAHGVYAGRLLLEGLVPRADYLKPFARVDIALDPFPYPGITTTVENLWMGVPVLTLAGTTFLSRQGVGLLNNAGLPEWVAADPDDYVARAARFAGDLPGLQRLRSGLRAQVRASPLFDAPRFARHLEEALRAMWRRWCEGQAAPGR